MKKKILGMALTLCVLAAFLPSVNAATVASGEAGYNAEWVFSDDGTLTISGTGNVYNYTPFSDYQSNINKVIIKKGITSIGGWYFFMCTNLRDVEIADSVTSIGELAFEGCTELHEIILPDSIMSIGSEAFHACSHLTEIKLPQKITRISGNTFYECNLLRTVYIPSGITEIEEGAFYDCENLKDVFFAGSAEEWNNIVIGDNNNSLKKAVIHYNNAEGEYPYEISSVSLRSNDGEYITAVPENESCIVNIAITERLSRAERDYMFIALYDEVEQLVGLNYIRADFSAAHGCEFGLNIPKQTEKISSMGGTHKTVN